MNACVILPSAALIFSIAYAAMNALQVASTPLQIFSIAYAAMNYRA